MQGDLQLQSRVQLFDIAFVIKKFSFCGALFKRILAWKKGISKKIILRMKLFLSLQFFTCHIVVNIRVWKYVFTRVVIKIKTFNSCRTRVVRVALVSHSCRSCSTRVALVSHSCCSYLTLVARLLHSCCTCVAFVSLVSGTRVVNLTRSLNIRKQIIGRFLIVSVVYYWN